VAFSRENDGGIVKKARFLAKNNPSVASRQLPLHKGAFCFVQIDICITVQILLESFLLLFSKKKIKPNAD
jgi:hypothetical protein